MIFASIGLVFAYLAPNHYPPWASFHADAVAALALMPVLIWALYQRGEVPSLTAGALLLALVPLLQLSVGHISFAGDAIIACLYITGFALAVFCGARIASSSNQGAGNSLVSLVPLQAAMVLAGLLSTAVALHQWLNLGLLAIFIVELPAGYRPFANLAQPNQLATLLMLGLAGIAFLYEARMVRASLGMVVALILSFGLAMTQSRTALLGLAVIWVAYLVLRKRAALRMKPVALALPTLLFLGSVWAWPLINDFLLLVDGGSMGERMGQNLRLTLWSSMMDAVSRSPWTGYGWNQVGLAQQVTALDHPATHYWFESSHNIVLDLALWAGLPVAILATCGMLFWFIRRVMACRDPLSWSLLVGISVVFCHAMVEYPLAYAYFLLPIGLFLGALHASTDKGSRRLWSVPRLVPVLVGFAAMAVFAKVVVEYLELEEEWRNVRMERSFVGGAPAAPARNILLLTQLKARAQFARMNPVVGMPPDQLEFMRRVAARYPTVTFMLPYARAAALNGQQDVASKVMATMCKVQSLAVCQQAEKEWSAFGFSGGVKLDGATPPQEPFH